MESSWTSTLQDAQDDKTYENNLTKSIGKNKTPSDKAFSDWENICAAFVNKQNNPVQEVVDLENGTGGNQAQTERSALRTKHKDETSYAPIESLSLDEGIQCYEGWKKQMQNYYLLSHHGEKDAEEQKAIFINNLDPKMFTVDFEETGKPATLANMLETTHKIFDERYPINARRARLFQFRQDRSEWNFTKAGKKGGWTR